MKKKRRKNLKAPEGLDRVLARAGENRFAKTSLAVPPRVWNDAVGLRVAERARPETLERGVLVIRVATSVWAHELSLLSGTILERLRKEGIEVRELRFKTAPIDAPVRPIETRVDRYVPPPVAVPTEVIPLLANIDDEELRGLLENALRSNLAWQGNQGTAQEHRPTGALPAVPTPRDAGRGNGPPAHTTGASSEDPRRTPGGGSSRRR